MSVGKIAGPGTSHKGVLGPKGAAYDFTDSSLHFTSKKVNSGVA